jgi:hypothetical protein
VREVALDSGKSIIFLVQVLESDIINFSLGMLYKYTLLEGLKNQGLKCALFWFGNLHIF